MALLYDVGLYTLLLIFVSNITYSIITLRILLFLIVAGYTTSTVVDTLGSYSVA